MASPVPAKSQQLHNFSLPQLKWKKNHLHRRRRATESPPHHNRSSSTQKESPIRDSKSELDAEKSEKDSKSKIYIRIRKSGKIAASESISNDNENHDQLPRDTEKGILVENCENEEVEEPKTWNLRPRKAVKKAMNVDNKGTMKIQENRTRIRTDVIDNNSVERNEKKKQKFSINLSREEVENDFLILTGSKPSRKPKKRAKILQKQLDNVFPGMWLSSVSPDCYKVPDHPIKG